MSEQLLTVAFFSWAQNILHVDTPFQQNHLRLHISPSDVPLYCSTSTSKYSAARHKNLSGVSRRPTGRCPKQSPGFRLAVHLLSCTRLFVHTFTISRDNAQQQSKQSPGCRHQDLIYSETQNSSYFGGKQLPHRIVGTFSILITPNHVLHQVYIRLQPTNHSSLASKQTPTHTAKLRIIGHRGATKRYHSRENEGCGSPNHSRADCPRWICPVGLSLCLQEVSVLFQQAREETSRWRAEFTFGRKSANARKANANETSTWVIFLRRVWDGNP